VKGAEVKAAVPGAPMKVSKKRRASLSGLVTQSPTLYPKKQSILSGGAIKRWSLDHFNFTGSFERSGSARHKWSSERQALLRNGWGARVAGMAKVSGAIRTIVVPINFD
jgi:hypothetical protein